MDSGVQCYVFLSKDQKTVLKLFKHYHLFPGNNLLAKIAVPHFLKPFQQKILQMRQERLQKIFKSCQFAYDYLQEETGTLFVHFHQSDCPKITVFDKLAIQHPLDLANTEFVLQKRAEEISLKRFSKKEIIEKLKNLHATCAKKGFKTKDTKIRNYAFIGEDPVLIDIGSLKRIKNPSATSKKFDQKLQRWEKEFEKKL